MRSRPFVVAAAVALSAALINPMDAAAQRQRSPGGNGGGRQQESRGGQERQRENGGGPQRANGGGQRENGGGRQRDDSGARPQGGGQAEVRAAQPRGGSVDRGDNDNRASGGSARRVSPPVVRETPPQQRPIMPPSAATADAGSQADSQARRRFPTAAERAEANGVVRDGGSRSTVTRDRADARSIDRVPGGTGRVAVPRDRAPYYANRNYPTRGYNVYRNYGGRNVYILPRGRTYYYYPGYYYNPYAFGYGPAGRGHFYFDLYYNSYIWHPYSVYRYDTYGTYGYPVGELRLKVHPSDAQVFIDGSYAGRVDDFDGVFQSLRLEEGEYQVEIVLPGFEPLAFNVRIFPGQKTTYEGDLIPELP